MGGAHDQFDEVRLARALARQQPEALAGIQHRYGPMLLGYLTGVLRDRATAEDVLQITLVEAWQRGRTFDPGRGSLSTWLLTIARSRAIDQLRRRVPEPQDLSAGELQDQGVEVHDEVDALLERWRIAGLLSRLAPEQAGLLRMRFHEELSQREIAARTGMPLGTVKMRMVQALERLRDLLDAEGAGDA